jgi:hypothetical protein
MPRDEILCREPTKETRRCCAMRSNTIGRPSAELPNHGYTAVCGQGSKELNITELSFDTVIDGKWFSSSQRREL